MVSRQMLHNDSIDDNTIYTEKEDRGEYKTYQLVDAHLVFILRLTNAQNSLQSCVQDLVYLLVYHLVGVAKDTVCVCIKEINKCTIQFLITIYKYIW